MIKQQKKWIALFVTLTFIWLMQVSTMPVAAAGTSAQAGVSRAEQGPDYYESVSQKAAPAKKKSMLPWILIGVGLLGVTAAVLFLVVLKTKYDITGEWKYFWKDAGDVNWYGSNQKLIFSGDKKNGTLIYYSSFTGTYSVDGKNVTFKFIYGTNDSVTHTGTFVDKDKMSGTWVYDQDASNTGSWEAVRVVTTAQIDLPQASAGVPGKTKSK